MPVAGGYWERLQWHVEAGAALGVRRILLSVYDEGIC